MIFFLFMLVFFLLIVVVAFNGFDFLSPDSWAILGFLLASLGGALNYSEWGDISEATIVSVIIALVAFIMGALLGKRNQLYINLKRKYNTEYSKSYNRNIHFKRSFVTLMNIFMIIVACFYLEFMFLNSIVGGGSGEFEHMFSYARMGIASDDAISMGLGLSLSIKLCFGFAHVQTYIVIQDILYRGWKSLRFCDFLSTFLYLIHTLLSGGRTKMLYFVLFSVIIAIVLKRNKNNWKIKSSASDLKYLIVGTLLGLFFFWIVDQTVRGSIYGNEFTMWDQFSKYISSPIYALSVYLDNPTTMSQLSETETLYPLISILNKLGSDIPFTNNALGFIAFGNTTTVITNIYTAIRRYIHDYGYLGLIAFMFFEGWLYCSWYAKIRKHRTEGIGLILYGILVYPVAFFFIEERFLNDLFTLTMMFQLICVNFFWTLVNKRVNVSSLRKVVNHKMLIK